MPSEKAALNRKTAIHPLLASCASDCHDPAASATGALESARCRTDSGGDKMPVESRMQVMHGAHQQSFGIRSASTVLCLNRRSLIEPHRPQDEQHRQPQ